MEDNTIYSFDEGTYEFNGGEPFDGTVSPLDVVVFPSLSIPSATFCVCMV